MLHPGQVSRKANRIGPAGADLRNLQLRNRWPPEFQSCFTAKTGQLGGEAGHRYEGQQETRHAA